MSGSWNSLNLQEQWRLQTTGSVSDTKHNSLDTKLKQTLSFHCSFHNQLSFCSAWVIHSALICLWEGLEIFSPCSLQSFSVLLLQFKEDIWFSFINGWPPPVFHSFLPRPSQHIPCTLCNLVGFWFCFGGFGGLFRVFFWGKWGWCWTAWCVFIHPESPQHQDCFP